MSKSIAQELMAALEDKGIDLNDFKSQCRTSTHKKKNQKQNQQSWKTKKQHPAHANSNAQASKTSTAIREKPLQSAAKSKPVSKAQPEKKPRISLGKNPRVNLDFRESRRVKLIKNDPSKINASSKLQGDDYDERELVLGLDFGTSSVKTVIGDIALDKAFAVPFQLSKGIEQYLLPCCLYESDGIFSLENGVEAHRDLKLSLIDNPKDERITTRASAFLALVIRHAKEWLLINQHEIYYHVKVIWKLSVGIPAKYEFNNNLKEVFKKIAHVAWLAASMTEEITTKTIAKARERALEISSDPFNASESEDVEIEVVPEIAAQIYGFVKSNRFNKNEKNIYLMVDVGAGTLDSSLFFVKEGDNQEMNFEFFKSIVEPHGVMNLHRSRIDWWSDALSEISDKKAEELVEELKNYKFPTDIIVHLPDCFKGYIKDAKVNVVGEEDHDQKYFNSKVLQQVKGKSYRDARNGLLNENELENIPVFYCGGGMRMPFYGQLREAMSYQEGCTWAKTIERQIEIPDRACK